MAALLCEHPTKQMLHTAECLGVDPEWGARNAKLYEIGTYPSFSTKTLLNRLSARQYKATVDEFMKRASDLAEVAYAVVDSNGQSGTLRYAIWSEILRCPHCEQEVSYFDCAMSRNPATFSKKITCSHCHQICHVDDMPFVTEEHKDVILKKTISRKKRVLAWIYGSTDNKNWDRRATEEDMQMIRNFCIGTTIEDAAKGIQWGELHRAGYHYGITHLHHFYTDRNYIMMSKLWKLTDSFPDKQSDALKLLLLSYNATHCTLMTRVVAKKNARDFALTGAQSGVLYIRPCLKNKNCTKEEQRVK